MGRLHVVTGKGGVGKTTVCLALAQALAHDGSSVLVCEVEGRASLARLAGISAQSAGIEAVVGNQPRLRVLSVDPKAALSEYLDKNFKLGLAGRAFDRTGMVEFATTIAPGLRDVLLLGKVYEAARRPGAYDAVILDAPPSGRVGPFLTAGDAIGDVAKVGPVHAQADRIMAYMRSDAVQVHVVALPVEMATTEAESTVADLRSRNLPLGRVITNRVTPAAPAGSLPTDAPDREALQRVLDDVARRRRAQAEYRARLAMLAAPITELPDVVGPDVVAQLAAALEPKEWA